MGETGITESLATEYLRLLDEGWRPDLTEFLGRVPDDHREECRERIYELADLNGMDLDAILKSPGPVRELADEISPAPEDEPEPELPGETAEEVAEAAAAELELEPPAPPPALPTVRIQRTAEQFEAYASHPDLEPAGIEELEAQPEELPPGPEPLSPEEAASYFPAEEEAVEEPPLEEPLAEEEAPEPGSFRPSSTSSRGRDEPRYNFPAVTEKKAKPGKKKAPQPAPVPVPAEAEAGELEVELQRHLREVGEWGRKGLIGEEDSDRLSQIYRRLLDPEPRSGIEELSTSLLHVLLHAVAVTAVLGSLLLVLFGAGQVSPAVYAGLPGAVAVALLAAGAWARFRLAEETGAAVFLAGGALALVPAVAGLGAALGLFGPASPRTVQIFPGSPVTNVHLLVACAAALLASAGGLYLTRRTLFAWMTALLGAAAYTSFLLTQNLLGLPPHQVALRLFPLVVLAVPALLFESRGRVRWALPFHLIALLALVGCVDAMALGGKLVQMVHLDGLLAASRQAHLGFAFSGLLLLVVTFFLERARSLDMHSGARFLRVVAALHLLVALYWSAAENGAWRDVLLYMGAVAMLLVLGRWRNRHALLVAGIAGLVPGAYLVLDLGLVGGVVFPAALAGGGLLAAFGAYAYLRRSRAAVPSYTAHEGFEDPA